MVRGRSAVSERVALICIHAPLPAS